MLMLGKIVHSEWNVTFWFLIHSRWYINCGVHEKYGKYCAKCRIREKYRNQPRLWKCCFSHFDLWWKQLLLILFSQVRLRLVKSCLIAVHSKDKNPKIKKTNIDQCDTKCTQVSFFTKRRKSLNIAERFHHNFITFNATAAIFVFISLFYPIRKDCNTRSWRTCARFDHHHWLTCISWKHCKQTEVFLLRWSRYFDGVEKYNAWESFGQLLK